MDGDFAKTFKLWIELVFFIEYMPDSKTYLFFFCYSFSDE